MAERELVWYRGIVYDSARWQGFTFRPDDIVISTPPKCGTTWTQMICALLILQRPRLDQPLSTLSPWLDMQARARKDVLADLEAQRHRRFIKTHTPLDGLPLAESVTYICVARDPRDVALSIDGHRANMDFERYSRPTSRRPGSMGSSRGRCLRCQLAPRPSGSASGSGSMPRAPQPR